MTASQMDDVREKLSTLTGAKFFEYITSLEFGKHGESTVFMNIANVSFSFTIFNPNFEIQCFMDYAPIFYKDF